MNKKEIHSLGQTIGHMHKLLNDGTLIEGEIPKFVPPTKEERLTYWEEKRRSREARKRAHSSLYKITTRGNTIGKCRSI